MTQDNLIQTDYRGEPSFHLPNLIISGRPRSGRKDNEVSEEERKRRGEWRKSILNAVREYKSPLPVNLPMDCECNLFVTFYLSDVAENDTVRYNILDLDNLLKPLQDTLKKGRIIQDDSLFIGVKVKKERVHDRKKEGVSLSVVTTKSLTIEKVEELPGDRFIEYWKAPAQIITATDEEGNQGTFIDHPPDVFLRDQYDVNHQLRDLVPGYPWKKWEGQKVSGCMIIKRRHHLKKEDHQKKFSHGKSKELHWLHKWDW